MIMGSLKSELMDDGRTLLAKKHIAISTNKICIHSTTRSLTLWAIFIGDIDVGKYSISFSLLIRHILSDGKFLDFLFFPNTNYNDNE